MCYTRRKCSKQIQQRQIWYHIDNHSIIFTYSCLRLLCRLNRMMRMMTMTAMTTVIAIGTPMTMPSTDTEGDEVESRNPCVGPFDTGTAVDVISKIKIHVYVKHYAPAVIKSKTLFLAQTSKSRSQGHWLWFHLKGHHKWSMHAINEVYISNGPKVIVKVKVDNRHTDRQTNRQTDRTKPICPRSFGRGHKID